MDIQSVWIIIVPIIVSIFVWLLTYIIPFIFPYQVTWLMLLFTKGMDPKDPIGIKILVNQFMKYNDWKRLTAMQRLRRIFKKKLNEIVVEETKKWKKYDKHLICIPFNRFMDDLEMYLAPLKESGKIEEIEEIIPKEYEIIKKNDHLTQFSTLRMTVNLKGEKINIWYYSHKNQPVDYKIIVNGLIAQYVPRVINSGFEAPVIDHSGILKKEEVIVKKLEDVDFIHMNKERIDQIFDETIIFLDDPQEKEIKEVLLHKFAYGLSNGENSVEALKRVIRDSSLNLDNKNF